MRKNKTTRSGEGDRREEQHPEYFRTPAASQYTGLSESTLAKLRMRHNRSKGPNFLKISGCVIYRRTDLNAWMDQHVVEEVGNA